MFVTFDDEYERNTTGQHNLNYNKMLNVLFQPFQWETFLFFALSCYQLGTIIIAIFMLLQRNCNNLV